MACTSFIQAMKTRRDALKNDSAAALASSKDASYCFSPRKACGCLYSMMKRVASRQRKIKSSFHEIEGCRFIWILKWERI